MQIWFDLEDIDAAIAELDAVHARFGERRHASMRDSACVPMQSQDAYAAIGRHGLHRDNAWDWSRDNSTTEIAAEHRPEDLVGFSRRVLTPSEWARRVRHIHATGGVRHSRAVADRTGGPPGSHCGSRSALLTRGLRTHRSEQGATSVRPRRRRSYRAHVVFDIEDLDAAIAELDAAHRAVRARSLSRRGAWKTRRRAYSTRMVAFCGPGLGCLGRNSWPTTIRASITEGS